MIEQRGDAVERDAEWGNDLDAAKHWLERDKIEYHALLDADEERWLLYPVDTPERGEIAETIARYFHRETTHDFRPYSAGDEEENGVRVFLIRSHRLRMCLLPIIGGAVGMRSVGDEWVLMWVWLHPWERGTGPDGGTLSRKTFDALEAEFGKFHVQAPLSKPMRAVASRRGYGAVTIEPA